MKIIAAILFVVVCVHANSTFRYGWAPDIESVYRFESQVLTGIPDIRNNQYAGFKLKAKVRVQSFQDYKLKVRIEQPRFITLNGEINLSEDRRIIENGGQAANPQMFYPEEFRRFLQEPIEVHIKRGLVENFFVPQDEPVAITNIKRSLLSQLQLDVSGSQLIEPNPMNLSHGSHKVVEQSIHGKCQTMYNINPMPPARVVELEKKWEEEELNARLPVSIGGKAACEGKTYYEIIKTRNLDHCEIRPVYFAVSGPVANGDFGNSHFGNLMTHMVSSTTYVCGELSSFNIRKIIVDDTIVKSPVPSNTEQTMHTSTRIMMELLEKKSITSSSGLTSPSQPRKEKSLVYAYIEERALRNQMSAEVVQKTKHILGIVPVLPQPSLTGSPASLMPHQLSPKQDIMNKIVDQLRRIGQEISESPESLTSELDITGKLLWISKKMQILSLSELEAVWSKTLSGTTGAMRGTTKYLLIDVIAMTGTNPSTMAVLKKIPTEIDVVKACEVIQSAIKSITTPTNELIRELLNFIKTLHNANNEQQRPLLTCALFQSSNLIYRAYVNHSTRKSNFPVRIYGVFGTEHSTVLVNEYIPLLKQMLQESIQSQNKHLKLVLISTLGKLGHLDAAEALVKVAQGTNNEEPMVRSLSIYSMKRVSKNYPMKIKPVLLAIINNPVEHADVRIAAIAVLPWAKPSYTDLQQIAVRSWYDTSNQVSSFSRSTFTSLTSTPLPELKRVSMMVKNILPLFKPTDYGLQYSKNIHIPTFVRYLLSSVSSEYAYTATKENEAISKLYFNQDIISESLGSGLKMNIQSFSMYSQGMDKMVDYTLKLAGYFEGVGQDVKGELVKIANELRLETRASPQFMSYTELRYMGYEYADFQTPESLMKMVNKLEQFISSGTLGGGIAGEYVTAMNLVASEAVMPVEAGFPIHGAQHLSSAMITNASISFDVSASKQLKVKMLSSSNTKSESKWLIVSPFSGRSEDLVGTGVTMSLHTSVPLEASISARNGELDIVLKTPDEIRAKGRSIDAIEAIVMPYTVRSYFISMEPVDKAHDLKTILSGEPLKRVTKRFSGPLRGEFSYESDNKFIDLYSYWEKINQNSLDSIWTVYPLMSSVRFSTTKLTINPALCEMKEISLKLRLWTRQPNKVMGYISKPINQAVEQEVESKGPINLKKALNSLQGLPAIIMKLEVSLKGESLERKFEAYTVLGSDAPAKDWARGDVVKSTVAAAIVIPQGNVYSALYNQNIRYPNIKSRWNIEQILTQQLFAYFFGDIVYGIESDQQSQKKINLKLILNKSLEQIASVRRSSAFKKCKLEANAGRILAPICLKARQQAGSFDKLQFIMKFPQEIYRSPVLPTIEGLVKAKLFAYYKPTVPVPHTAEGKIKLELVFTRASDVVQINVEHHNDAYTFNQVRIPHAAKHVMPLSAINSIEVGDWIEQKLTKNYYPASCRIQPEIVSTFDNKTYGYKINDCEHVLMMDGSKHLPVAVLARTLPGGTKKVVKVIAYKTTIEMIPDSRSLKVKLNGRDQIIASGQTFIEKDPVTGHVIVEIKRFEDDVYHVGVPNLHVLTDGNSIELHDVSQLLRGHAVGLCGDLNGEEVADLPSPRKCIMKPKLAAMSYMLNKEGNNANSHSLRCAGIPAEDLQEYKREEQECVKERFVPTTIVPIFERLRN